MTCLPLLLASLIASAPPAEVVERHVAAMGTSLAIEVEAPDRKAALAASEAALRALATVERRLSTWGDGGEPSELATLNRTPVGEPCPLSAELARDLAAARRWWLETDGAFDPGIGALVQAFGLRSGGRRPEEPELARALECGGLRSLEVDVERRAATRRHPALILEEGGFGKGVGLDAALEALRGSAATHALLDLGGQVALYGERPRDVRLAHPVHRSEAALEVRLDGGSLATTGNSERAILVDGERKGHVLDPRTGRFAADFGSLSVWAPDATAADCLSTGLYVLGPDAALEWAEGREAIEVIVLETRGENLRVRATAGLSGRLRALDDSITIHFQSERTR